MAYDNKYIRGVDVTVTNLNRTPGFVAKEAAVAVQKGGKILDAGIKRNISKTDHSLRDLAKMGHPYARRAPRVIHQPEYAVHKQSGDLLSSFYSADFDGGYGSIRGAVHVAGVNEAVAPQARFVIMGTRTMVSRNFLGGTLEEKRDEIRQAIIKHMGSKQTWAGLRFQGVR